MAAVGPPPGVVGAQDVLQALQGAEHMQRNTSDTARQRFAHARRVLETIKHGLDDASTALALAEGQLTTTTSPSSRYDGTFGVNENLLTLNTSSSGLVAVNPGPWSPAYNYIPGRPLSGGGQDQQAGDIPADALIASRPASRQGCARHHPSHPSQDAPLDQLALVGPVEHQTKQPTANDAHDHVTLDECSLAKPAHIRKDDVLDHSSRSPSPELSANDRCQISQSSYDAHAARCPDVRAHSSPDTSERGPYGIGACGFPDIGQVAARPQEQEAACLHEQETTRLQVQETARLREQESRQRKQAELRQQVWEAKKRALEAEAARVREARAGSARSPEISSAEVDGALPPSLTRRSSLAQRHSSLAQRHSSLAHRRHSSPAPPRRLVDRIEAPRLLDRIEPRRASISLIDRIEPLPAPSSPPATQSTSLIDRIERTPCASPWRSPTPSLGGSSSTSVDDFDDPAVDVYSGDSIVRSPSPLFLSPTPHASSSEVAWSDADAFIHEAIHKSPSSDAQRTLNDTQRTLYNADQAGWTPSSPAASVASEITHGVEEMVVDDEEDRVVLDGGEGAGADEVRAGFDDGARTAVDVGKGPGVDEDHEGEMPMEFSEDEGDADDGTQRGPLYGSNSKLTPFVEASPSSADTSPTPAECSGSPAESWTSPPDSPSAEPPATPTEPGSPTRSELRSPTLTKLAFFDNVPLDEPSPTSSPTLSLVEEQPGSPYASRVQGLLESTPKSALEITSQSVIRASSQGQDADDPHGQGGDMDLRPPSPAHLFSLEGRGGVLAHPVRIPLPPPVRFGTPYYSTDLNVETPATLRYPELPEPSAYVPSQSSYAHPPSQSVYAPPPSTYAPPSSAASAAPSSASTNPEPSSAPRALNATVRTRTKTKAPAHSRLYKKARRSLAKSSSSATARDIKTIAHRAPAMNPAVRPPSTNSSVRPSATNSIVRPSATTSSVRLSATTSTVPPPVANPTVGARLVAASAPPPGQVVTFAQLGAGYRLTSTVLDSGEGASESGGEEDSSDSDLDSLFDEIPEDSVDAGSGHPSEHPNSSDPHAQMLPIAARSEEIYAKMNTLTLEEDSASHQESPLLPVELVEEIVAQLPYRSAILKKCCLVSRSWVTPCRARLFAHLSIYPRAYPSGLLDLSESDLALTAPPTIRHQLIALLAMPAAFAAAPDIPQYVRGLSVQMMRLATPSDRTAAAEAAVEVLKLFPRLHTLTLDARALDYPDFSPALQSTLCDILGQPALTSLHLREQDVTDAGVHALLRSARHLRRLSIWPRPLLYVRLDGEDVPALPAGSPRPQLHTLHLVGPFDAALAWASAPHCPLDLRALRTLSLSPRRAFDMGGAFARFAAAHGAGVRTLVVSLCDVWSVVGNDVGAAAGLAFLDHMPALRIIRVKDGVLAPWSLVCAVRLLEVAVRKTGVEVFELRVAIWPANADSYRRKEIHLDHWREVDSRLAAVREESSLRRMDFVAVPDEEASQADADRLQNWVEYALPNFAAGGRDILHFSAVDGGMPWDETTAWDRGTVWADTD
ncbi:hypothetical protein K523DRAFT_341550 [Schizophyllum commune Tattone D]|nr:hypothetical protein K523DRAFT_341550 [Schizophyllum commune Tattone D]